MINSTRTNCPRFLAPFLVTAVHCVVPLTLTASCRSPVPVSRRTGNQHTTKRDSDQHLAKARKCAAPNIRKNLGTLYCRADNDDFYVGRKGMLYQLEGRTGCQKKAFNISPLCGTDIEISSDGRYAACLTYSEKLLVFKRNIMSYQAYHQENAQLFQFGGPNTLLVRTDHSYFLLMLGRNPIARKPISITGMVSGNDALQMAAVSVDEVNRAVHFLMIPQAGILAAVLVTNSIRTGRTTSRLPVGNTGLIPHPARNVHSFSSDGMLAVISRKCAIDIWAKTTGATNRWKMHRRIASGKCTGMYAAAVSKKHNIVARVDSQGKHQLMSLIQGKNVKTWKSGSSSQRAAPEICITGSGRYVVSKFDGHLPDVHSAK